MAAEGARNRKIVAGEEEEEDEVEVPQPAPVAKDAEVRSLTSQKSDDTKSSKRRVVAGEESEEDEEEGEEMADTASGSVPNSVTGAGSITQRLGSMDKEKEPLRQSARQKKLRTLGTNIGSVF